MNIIYLPYLNINIDSSLLKDAVYHKTDTTTSH